MKKKFKILASIININILIIMVHLIYLNITLPNNYNYINGSNININGKKYITLDIKNQKTNTSEIQTSNFNFCKTDFIKNYNGIYKNKECCNNNIYSNHNNSNLNNNFETFIKAYNIFPIKQVDIHSIEPIEVYPCGTPFGIKMFTKGVMVVGLGEVDKGITPSKDAGLRLGDMILSIDDIPIYNNNDIINIINKSKGKDVFIKVIRNDIEHTFKLTPQKSSMQNAYKAGMWVRNSTAGIGTLTFYTENGYFAGLGHPVCDIDTGQIMPLLSGEIINVKINGINKGKSGYPGELKGTFCEEKNIGLLMQNTSTGIYGRLTDFNYIKTHKKMPIAMAQDIEEGPAKILSTIDGATPEYFDITIDKINYSNINPCKNMIIKIVDKKLISKTGGIVQGMSGSPIIQNGKIVGAITHVFVNQPLKGYGIFVENMFETTNNI